MGPIILLDKSAFHRLSTAEMSLVDRNFKQAMTPILATEILGDLAKRYSKNRRSEDEVTKLARKSLACWGTVCVDFRSACLGDLLGNHPAMTGQIPVAHARTERAPDGALTMIIEPHPINLALIRWSEGRFSNAERKVAEAWREKLKRFGIHTIEERLERGRVIVKRAGSLSEVVGVADGLMAEPGLQLVWIDWLLDELAARRPVRDAVHARWRAAWPTTMERFAPYAHHCVRTQLALYVATRERFLGGRRTDTVDIRYLYYAPFCMVFTSADVVHDTLGPLLLRPNQTYVRADDLKAALAGRHRAAETGATVPFDLIDRIWNAHLMPRPDRPTA